MKTLPLNTPRENSPLSLAQWESLERLAKDAVKAVESFDVALLIASNSGDDETNAMLAAYSKRVHDAFLSLPASYLFHPQPEWVGGDSSDPKNTIIREPHVCGMRRLAVTK